MITNKNSGVNQDQGNICSRIMYEASRKTWKNRKGISGEVKSSAEDFSSLRFSSLNNKNNVILNFDGVGTKIEIAERLSTLTKDFSYHKGIAHDLFAMVCDDAVIRGAEPVIVGSILDVNKLNTELIKKLAEGMVEAANEANVAVVNGEIAELGNRINGYGEFNYNWGAAVLSTIESKNLINLNDLKVGDSVVALKENGLRSNGFSLARKILENKFGREWHVKNTKIAGDLLIKSIIYTKPVLEIIKKAKPNGISHVTGGGIPEKLSRILREVNKGAMLNDLFEPPEFVRYLQRLGNIKDEEAYSTWNMGNGMLIITNNPEKTIQIAKKYKVEAKIAGTIIKENQISIKSRGFFSEGKEIKYKIKE